MRNIIVSVGPLATAVANNIALTQSVGAGASVVLNGALVTGGVAVLDKPRRIAVTSAGNDSAVLFTITGTNWSGLPWTEVLTGANAGTATSVLDYATVTKIVAGSATASTITVGTSAVASTPWVRVSEYGTPQVALQADVTGTVNYTGQSTLDDPNDASNPVAPYLVNWVNTTDPSFVGATTTLQSNFIAAPRWVRVLLNSGTGMVTLSIQQLGPQGGG